MTEDIEIKPYPIDQSIAYVRVMIENFELNAIECYCSVYEYGKDDKFINMSRVYIPPEVYQNWGVSDDYIIDYCLDQLGFERKPQVNINFPV